MPRLSHRLIYTFAAVSALGALGLIFSRWLGNQSVQPITTQSAIPQMPTSTPIIATETSPPVTPRIKLTPTLHLTSATPTPSPTYLPFFLEPTASWITPVTDQFALTLHSLSMFDPNTGWAVGFMNLNYIAPAILHTQDSGKSWQDVTPTEPNLMEYEGIVYARPVKFFLDSQTAWLVSRTESGPVVWHTQDGGQTWKASPPLDTNYIEWGSISGEPLPLRLYFLDRKIGWLQAGAYGKDMALFKTLNGGANWKPVLDVCTQRLSGGVGQKKRA